MKSRITQSIVFSALTLTLGVLSLTGCATKTKNEDTSAEPSVTVTTPVPRETGTPQESEPEMELSPNHTAADWAYGVTAPGELLGSVTSSRVGYQIDFYQVGVRQAAKASTLVDKESFQPLINVGDEIVYVNWIVTNVSQAPIVLNEDLINVHVSYADSATGDLAATSEPEVFRELNINENAIDEDKAVGLVTNHRYILEPGHSYSMGTNFKHEAGGKATFSITSSPVDEQGMANADIFYREKVVAVTP